MALFDWFSTSRRRFLPEKEFREKLARQLQMTPLTLEQLRKLNVTPVTQLNLEYFFYTNSPDKAASLASALKGMGYEVESGPSASDKKQQVITGWTLKIPMSDVAVAAWTRKMCEVGYEHDCEFDGWGTNPAQ